MSFQRVPERPLVIRRCGPSLGLFLFQVTEKNSIFIMLLKDQLFDLSFTRLMLLPGAWPRFLTSLARVYGP